MADIALSAEPTDEGGLAAERGAAAPLRTLLVSGALVFALGLALLLIGVTAAKDVYFDETWYVPAAREWLKSGEMTRQEHPALAKLLIAFGLWLFGDNPLGWRAMSVVFGAITLFGVWLWTLALTRSNARALWAAAVTFAGAVVFVQARIAMLDIFLMAFLMLGLAFFTFSFKVAGRRAARIHGVLAGLSLGLAGACKISGFFLLLGLIGFVGFIALLRHWRARLAPTGPDDFYSEEIAARWSPGFAALALGVAPLASYVCAFAPQMVHAGSAMEFIATHRRMFQILSGHSADHPYMSQWYTWPWMWRPVWYLFLVPGLETADWSDAHPASAVDGLPNPFVAWSGELAILWCMVRALRRRDLNAAIVGILFLSEYLPWCVNPKGLEFFYYFYPSLLACAPALALILFNGRGRWGGVAPLAYLAVAAGFFVFFLPILAAGVGVTPEQFEWRIWFESWR